MFVNVSRSKLLINNRSELRKPKKSNGKALRCNHCGGPIRANGEIQTCIMCSREAGHSCSNCSHALASEVPEARQKTA